MYILEFYYIVLLKNKDDNKITLRVSDLHKCLFYDSSNLPLINRICYLCLTEIELS